MPTISAVVRLIIWIVSGVFSIIFLFLTFAVEPNIAYYVRRLFGQKRGKPPNQRPLGLWIIIFISGLTGILGSAIAASAPALDSPTTATMTPSSIVSDGSSNSTTSVPVTLTTIPNLTITPALTRILSLQGECEPQPSPTNMPCLYKATTPSSDTPHEIAYYLFGSNTELADKYTGAIYELLRNENGYWGGTSVGIRIDDENVWVIVPYINETRDIEYYHEYLNRKFEICTVDGERPCLYVVSEITNEYGINNYETIARYFSNLAQCVRQANRVIFKNSNSYPEQVKVIEDDVVLVIPVAMKNCE